jgi:hypothetical protein
MNARTVVFLACLALACREPFVVLPGGKLGGEVLTSAPEFTSTDRHGTAQLETRPDDPYSVNFTYTVVSGRIYANAGDTETTWAKNVNADPRVRLRVDGALYELRAERVTDPAEIAVFGKAWLSQSSTRRDPSGFDEVWLYRLEPRQ